ncbi:uncharacterized protein LOC135343858 [Halichondria panicea]|uniref:uncharacterized protein LOC135343858 n=1 Tax=Halichondria panicea TaxID=6063 RepID=UPI00312B7017
MSETLRLCRLVLRELQKIDSQARTGQFWSYVRAEVTKSTADDVTPKQRLLKTCVSYLESSRQHREIVFQYQGRGERSVKDTANLVGLKVPPNTLKEDFLKNSSGTARS